MINLRLKDFRCTFCQKLLFKGDLKKALIEIKCRNCKTVSIFDEELIEL